MLGGKGAAVRGWGGGVRLRLFDIGIIGLVWPVYLFRFFVQCTSPEK